MPDSSGPRDLRMRRTRLIAAVALLALVSGSGAVALTITQQRAAEPSATAADTASGVDDVGTDGPSPGDIDTASLSTAVAAQVEYLAEHWNDTDSEQFGFLAENDCVNFASQSLLARGWPTDDEWWYSEDGDPWSHSTAWISSTAFMEYLEAHPDRATALTDDQRASVKVGDIVQFDWDDSGDRDHTGIVTSVETDADGTVRIGYAGHTDATWDRSVDWAITELHPGGIAYYWSIPE